MGFPYRRATVSATVTVSGLWKSYREKPQLGIKEFLIGRKLSRSTKFSRAWALKDLSFSVSPGNSFGIVGHNGSGKSTLLGILLGAIVPDKGNVEICDSVASLLDLGAGFHPELTGRENVFLHGAILGMTIAEVRQRFDNIIEFSELDTAIDNPIRTYSNGMIARLGFSIIAHSPAKILLIDEILAVGDSSFRSKCFAHLMHFKKEGGTLIIVSHEMETISYLCDEGLCLNEGLSVKQGNIKDVIAHYDMLVTDAEELPASKL